MKILGPKEIGHGILIEYDAGHVSPEDNKQIIREAREMDFSQDLILYAVLQKFDTPNKNGRIYPEMLLKRENEKYQVLIKKGGALNELNHPSSSLIDLDRVSHSILETWWDGKIIHFTRLEEDGYCIYQRRSGSHVNYERCHFRYFISWCGFFKTS